MTVEKKPQSCCYINDDCVYKYAAVMPWEDYERMVSLFNALSICIPPFIYQNKIIAEIKALLRREK